MPVLSPERRQDGIGTYHNFIPHLCISDVQNDTFKVAAYEAGI